MEKATGVQRFYQLRYQTYAKMYDTIIKKITQANEAGHNRLEICSGPPRVLRIFVDQLLEAGYDVTTVESGYGNFLGITVCWGRDTT